MIGVYLSGTGNTKHCIEKLIYLLDETAQAVPIEGKETVRLLSQHEFIVLAYPVQFSNAPPVGSQANSATIYLLEQCFVLVLPL